jgi:hypothetical protein
MSTITYNNVELKVTLLHTWEREPIYDAADNYLYTRHRIAVAAVYNPKATSYDFVNFAPRERADKMPAETDVAVREALELPRKTLLVEIDGEDVLATPEQGKTTDVCNGPTPSVHRWTKIHGSRTIEIDWTVEACVIDKSLAGTRPILLSHVWKMSEDIDQDYFATRTIQGKAVFRRDLLEVENANKPDDYRGFFMHAVHAGMKRVHIDVEAPEDGRTLLYTVVDRDQKAWSSLPGLSRFELKHTVGVKSPLADAVVGATIGLTTDAVRGWRGKKDKQTGEYEGAHGFRGASLGVFAGAGSFLSAAMPRKHIISTATAYGSPEMNMTTLLGYCLRLVNSRFRAALMFGPLAYNIYLEVTMDWDNRAVAVMRRHESSLLDGVVGVFQQVLSSRSIEDMLEREMIGLPLNGFSPPVLSDPTRADPVHGNHFPLKSSQPGAGTRDGSRSRNPRIVVANALNDPYIAPQRPARLATRNPLNADNPHRAE